MLCLTVFLFSFLHSTGLSPGDSQIEVRKRSVRNTDDTWHKWGFLSRLCVCETCTLIFEQAGTATVNFNLAWMSLLENGLVSLFGTELEGT